MNEEHRDEQWERAEKETGGGTKLAFGMFPVYAGLAALAVMLYFFFPAPWVALSLVVIGFVVAGVIAASGMHRTRRRG
jgi:hypothetical protein